METRFTDAQRADPDIRTSEQALRRCVHCGFCTATCPTYVLLGDERDSPRGRIWLIKEMLERGGPVASAVVPHIDRCLGCLACTTTCPSGVDYARLIDHARHHVERTHRRPWADALVRGVLARLLPHAGRFRLAVLAGRLARPLGRLLPRGGLSGRLRAMLELVPARAPAPLRPAAAAATPRPAAGASRGRVLMLGGCVQPVLAPEIDAAAERLLRAQGWEVVRQAPGCCGALVLHMGRRAQARRQAARAVRAAWAETAAGGGAGLAALVITASGCGTTVKDWGHLLAGDPELAGPAEAVAALARDVTELLDPARLRPSARAEGLAVAYHAACSLQHGQKLDRPPRALLKAAGFRVVEVPEGHLCCGSAGTYNLLQPELSERLAERKRANIALAAPDLVAAGNLGCIAQIGRAAPWPIVHTAQLLDWSQGGPRPPALVGLVSRQRRPADP